MGDNVVLVGFMGAGKSSVGRLLARRMGRCFVETDDMITAREGRSIPEIFAERGEAHFRALEEETVRLLALKSGDVIATGGGLYCRDGRPEALRAIGTVVWLTGSFDALYERARRMGERPMLAGRTRDEVADHLSRARGLLPPGRPLRRYHRPQHRPGGHPGPPRAPATSLPCRGEPVGRALSAPDPPRRAPAPLRRRHGHDALCAAACRSTPASTC